MAINRLSRGSRLMVTIWVIFSMIISASLVGCTSPAPPPSAVDESAVSLTSDAFTDGSTIPQKYTCRGDNVSPALQWDGVPNATKSLALIMDDPDAPIKNFTHWVVFNIPPDTRELSEAIPGDEKLSNGALQGKNGAMQIGYFGPCPPPGGPHHYNFVLYALDTVLDLDAGASKEQVLSSMEGYIIGRGQLVGLFQQ
jgi:Raf kinase inhibitor-like YbhB/YbcL family protein